MMPRHLLMWVSAAALLGCGPKPNLDADTCDNNTNNDGEVCFEAPPLLVSPTPLFDAVLFDIDADTLPDLITASDGNALIFRGDPGGGFKKADPLFDKIASAAPSGSKTRRIFSPDLNGDSIPDLLLLVEEPNNRGAIYSLLRLTGDDFQAAVRSPLSGVPIDAELTLRDGGSTIVVLREGALEIQQGDIGGSFSDPRIQALGVSAARDIAPTLLDGDKIVDLLLADAFSAATRLIGNQDGTFIDSGSTLIPPSNALLFSQGFVISADAGIGSVSVLRDLGGGDFEPFGSLFVGDEPRDIKAADLDGDGVIDLAVTGGITSAFLRGLGGGDFQEANPIWAGAGLSRVFIQDVTFDGALDVFSVGALGVSFMEGRLGSMPEGLEIALGRERPKVAALGDIDLDGDQDLALSVNSGLLIAKNNAQGQFNFAAPTLIPLDPTPVAITIGDFDGDGDQDIVTLDPQNPLDPNSEGTGRIIVNQGGVFNAQSVLPLSDLPAGTGALLSLDQNNDQRSDLIAIGRTAAILQSDGQRFTNTQTINATDATQATLIDLNQDGVSELLVGQGGAVKIFIGPAFTEERSISITGNASLVSAADVNEDEIVDLVVLDTASPVLLVLPGLGDFAYAAPLTGVVPEGAQGLAVGDFDADNTADVLVVGASLSQVFSVEGGSLLTRTTRGAAALPIGGVSGILLNQDIDGDGTIDLVLPAQERGIIISRQKR